MLTKPTHVLLAVAVLGAAISATHFVSANAADSHKTMQSSPFEGEFVRVTASNGLEITLENTKFIALNGRPMLRGLEVVTAPRQFRSTGVTTYVAWDSIVTCVVQSEEVLGERVSLP